MTFYLSSVLKIKFLQHYPILIEATKSFTSLSKTEKAAFAKKYEECRKKNLKNIARTLQKVKPYLKKKHSKCDVKNSR